MSTLRANTIEHTDGGPIAFTKQHALKAFACVDQTVTGHTAFESFNVASTTDNGTGRTAIAYSNNMNTASHAVTLADNGQNLSGSCSGVNSDTNASTTTQQKRTVGHGMDCRDSANANRDKDDVSTLSAGDLA